MTSFDEDTQAVVLEVAEAIRASLEPNYLLDMLGLMQITTNGKPANDIPWYVSLIYEAFFS